MSEENLPPDVASMVKRLRLLPVKISECEEPRWEDFPKDQREGLSRETAYSLGHAAGVLNAVQVAQPEIDALAALLSRLGQTSTTAERAIMVRLQKEVFNGEAPDRPHDRYARSCIQDVLNNYPGGVCFPPPPPERP